MDRDIAAEARNELKKIGLNSRQVSVRYRIVGYSDELKFTIRDDKVSFRKVNEIAKRFEYLRYDEYSGDFLEGCNTFVDVVRVWKEKDGPAMPEDFKEAWKKVLENSRTDGKRGEGTTYGEHILRLDEQNNVNVFSRNADLPYHRSVYYWGDGLQAMRYVWFMIYNDRLDLEYLESKKEMAG